MVHHRLLEQLMDFEACALAWLGECAPDLVAKAKSLSAAEDDLQMDETSTAMGDALTPSRDTIGSVDESSSTSGTATKQFPVRIIWTLFMFN